MCPRNPPHYTLSTVKRYFFTEFSKLVTQARHQYELNRVRSSVGTKHCSVHDFASQTTDTSYIHKLADVAQIMNQAAQARDEDITRSHVQLHLQAIKEEFQYAFFHRKQIAEAKVADEWMPVKVACIEIIDSVLRQIIEYLEALLAQVLGLDGQYIDVNTSFKFTLTLDFDKEAARFSRELNKVLNS